MNIGNICFAYCRVGNPDKTDDSEDDLKRKKNELKERYDRAHRIFSIPSLRHYFNCNVTLCASPDGDEEYLKRCLNLYKKLNIMSYGVCLREEDIASQIGDYLAKLNPDILVITGHDAYYKRKGSIHDIHSYKNTENFINAVKSARKYEKDQDKLIIIAGACQSNYEELIKSGATFASSPKRINIHALDPAVIASGIALSDRNQTIDLVDLLEKTRYGSEGIGGVVTKGAMFVGYPR